MDLAELIPSKDVREYMKQKKRVLTDFEKATLIYNHSSMGLSEKTERLRELMELTADFNLREEIRERLFYDECCLKKFFENDGSYIYKLQVYDPEGLGACEQGLYTDGNIAVACGKKFSGSFGVCKIVLLNEEKEPEDCREDISASIYYNTYGELRNYYSLEVEWIAEKSESDNARFENAFVDIPHPFRNGDFVKVKNNDRIEGEVCIVECFDAESRGRFRNEPSAFCGYEDVSLRVAYVYGLGRFGHEHVNIVDVEYARPDEENLKYELLYCAQSLILGRGGLSELQYVCYQYESRLKRRK